MIDFLVSNMTCISLGNLKLRLRLSRIIILNGHRLQNNVGGGGLKSPMKLELCREPSSLVAFLATHE